MSGASGFVGTSLSLFLSNEGHEIIPLGRELFRPENEAALCRILSTCHAVVNLAGAPINKRWTRTYKHQLIDSRVTVTRSLTRAMKKSRHSPAIFVSTSAVGYYPQLGRMGRIQRCMWQRLPGPLVQGVGSRRTRMSRRYPAGHHPIRHSSLA